MGISVLISAQDMVAWACCRQQVRTPHIVHLMRTLDDLRRPPFRTDRPRTPPLLIAALPAGVPQGSRGSRAPQTVPDADLFRIAKNWVPIDDTRELEIEVAACHPLLRRWHRLIGADPHVLEAGYLSNLPPAEWRRRALVRYRALAVGISAAYHLLMALLTDLERGRSTAELGFERNTTGYSPLNATGFRAIRTANAFLWGMLQRYPHLGTRPDSDRETEDGCLSQLGRRDCLPGSDYVRVWPTGCSDCGEARLAPDDWQGCPGDTSETSCEQVRWASVLPEGFTEARPGECFSLGGHYVPPTSDSSLLDFW